MASEFYLQTLQNYRERKGFFRPSLDSMVKAAMADPVLLQVKPPKIRQAKAKLIRHVRSVAKHEEKLSGGHPQRSKRQRRKRSK